jgi:hypothetical protein
MEWKKIPPKWTAIIFISVIVIIVVTLSVYYGLRTVHASPEAQEYAAARDKALASLAAAPQRIPTTTTTTPLAKTSNPATPIDDQEAYEYEGIGHI